jgi:hypothetical protein
MPSPLRDPKSLAEWLRLDYFRQPRRLRRLLRLATWAALLAGAVLLALALWPASHSLHQAGPLSTAHAMFSNDCRQCHAEFFRPVQRLWQADGSVRSVSDASCLRCHDGPLHNPLQAQTPACVTCHREHRGRAALARPDDPHCTSCHADLRSAGGQGEFRDVHSFASHPEFRLWSQGNPTDPGTVRFSHHAHLDAAGVRAPGGQRVRLDCASCHEPDEARRYMKPVSYDAHCKSCHPLSFPVAAEPVEEALARAVREFSKLPAPHKEPLVVRGVLRERFTRFARANPAILSAPLSPPPVRPIPGRPPAAPPADPGAWVDYQLEQADRALFLGGGGCGFCHTRTAPDGPDRLPQFAKSNIPRRWFEHSTFRHDSHRLLRCFECHGDVSASRASRDVLLPRIDSCRQCHNPQVGARSDCAECHLYHDRRHERPFDGKLTVRDCTGRAPR